MPSGLEEQIRRSLRRAAEPGDPSGAFEEVARRRSHQVAARRLRFAALAAVVVAGTALGLSGLRTLFGAGEPDPGLGSDPSRSSTTEPSRGVEPSPGTEAAAPSPIAPDDRIPEWLSAAWEDPACASSARIADFDGDGEPDIAMVTRNECLGPDREQGWVVALDWALAGGTIEAAVWPLADCDETCAAFTAPDLDADGASELGVVVNTGASTQFLEFFQLPVDVYEPEPLHVSQPGAPGFPPLETALFAQGGSATHMDQLACRDAGVERDLLHSSASLSQDDGVWVVVENRFRLIVGRFVVMQTREYQEPFADGPEGPSFLSGEDLCGANLGGDVIDG